MMGPVRAADLASVESSEGVHEEPLVAGEELTFAVRPGEATTR